MKDVTFNLFLGAQAVATIVLLVFVWYWPVPWNAQRVAGSVLLILGTVLVSSARLQLGRSFSLTPQARKLVTHSLYSKIRNPIYLFGTVAIIGFCLIVQRPALWLSVVLVVALQTVRARREARVLEAKFGDEYRAYRNRTWF